MGNDFDAVQISDDESGSTVGQRSVEEAVELARQQGLEAFFPLEDELFLDIDATVWAPPIKVFKALLNPTEPALNVVIDSLRILRTRSKSGNLHIYLKFTGTLHSREKVIVQAAMGSDPVKEVLTMLRMKAGDHTGTICLFETPEQAERVKQWRGWKALL